MVDKGWRVRGWLLRFVLAAGLIAALGAAHAPVVIGQGDDGQLRATASIAVETDKPGDGRSSFRFFYVDAVRPYPNDIAVGSTKPVATDDGGAPSRLGLYQLEDPGPEWELADISCDDDGAALPSLIDLSARSVEIALSPGSDAVCTFTLTPSPRGSLGLTIVTEPASLGGTYEVLFARRGCGLHQ